MTTAEFWKMFVSAQDSQQQSALPVLLSHARTYYLYVLSYSAPTPNLGSNYSYVYIHILESWGTGRVKALLKVTEQVAVSWDFFIISVACGVYGPCPLLFWVADLLQGKEACSWHIQPKVHPRHVQMRAVLFPQTFPHWPWPHAESTCQEFHSYYCPKALPCWNPDKSSLLCSP